MDNHKEWERVRQIEGQSQRVGERETDRWTITESGREVGGSETDRWTVTESGRE